VARYGHGCFYFLGTIGINIEERLSGQITALKVQKRNRQRVNVYVDGRFAFGLAAIEAMRLKVGQQLSAAEITRLKERDRVEVAYDRALNFLSYRPRSIAEVKRRLTEKGFDLSAVDEVVDRLQRAGLLNDKEFVRFWLENRDTFKPRSRRALRYELRQKGVADSAINGILTDYDDNDAAYRAALSQAQKLARRYDSDTLRSKLLAFLSRRGFVYMIAREAVDEVLKELSEDGAIN
jgi:regulatory protein